MSSGSSRLVGAGVAVTFAVSLAGCANSDALVHARQACTHVKRSITLYERSLHESDPQRQTDSRNALFELRKALPLAATAAGQEPQWQALMTDLSEASQVPEANLVSSLRQLCQVADSPGGAGGGVGNVPGGSDTSNATGSAP